MSNTGESVIWRNIELYPKKVTGLENLGTPDTAQGQRLVPFNPRFEDIYRSSGTHGLGGLEQARHVFLSGCGLTGEHRLWQGHQQWRILETGFGLGLNFLATWLHWQKDPHAPKMLHYVSIEAHPVNPSDILKSVEPWPELHALAQELVESYWGVLPGFHKLILDNAQVHLTLIVGDVQDALKQLEGTFDSVYLDGFSPSKNPQMWSALTMKGIASHSTLGTKVATWSVAKTVKEGLKEAGFEVEITHGLPPKREQLRAVYRPHWLMQAESNELGPHIKQDSRPDSKLEPEPKSIPRHEFNSQSRGDAQESSPSERSCVVIGAGLAGASVARSLAMRGFKVRVIDTHAHKNPEPHSTHHPTALGWGDESRPLSDGAHGLPLALFHPMFTGDENLQSRLIRAGIRVLLGYLRHLDPSSSRDIYQVTGVLEHKKNSKSKLEPAVLAQLERQRLAAPFYADWTQEATPQETENTLKGNAFWHSKAGWVKPTTFINALLDHPNIECLPALSVLKLIVHPENAEAHHWTVQLGNCDAPHTLQEISCSTLIIAAGPQSQALLNTVSQTSVPQADNSAPRELHDIAKSWPLQAIKGQVTLGWMADLEVKPSQSTPDSNEADVFNRSKDLHLPSQPDITKGSYDTNKTYKTYVTNLTNLRELPPSWPKLPAHPIHGSISWTPNIEFNSPKGLAYVMGSTFERDQPSIQNSPKSRMRNWSHLQALMPELVTLEPKTMELLDWSGVRSTCPDRVPLCGPIKPRGSQSALKNSPSLMGLYVVSALGSRGVALCTLMAEVLSAHLNHEPQALPKRLLKAIDPMRFMDPL